MSGPFILVPLPITTAMLSSSSIAEPASGETLWDAATSYTVGQQVIRTATHRIYESLIAGVNATPPENAVTRWLDVGPTSRWAAFDTLVSTQSKNPTTLTYVLRPGLFNAIAFYGLSGVTITVSIKDQVGGAVFFTKILGLQAPPIDYYDYYFGVIRPLTKLLIKGILPQSDPELTITISASGGTSVAVGMIAIGNLTNLILNQSVGGTQYGAKAKPITYSYINTDKYGTTTIVKRGSATDLDIRVHIPQADADAALAIVQTVLDQPVAVIASDNSSYSGLNVFGLISGDVSYDSPTHAFLSMQVKGII